MPIVTSFFFNHTVCNEKKKNDFLVVYSCNGRISVIKYRVCRNKTSNFTVKISVTQDWV